MPFYKPLKIFFIVLGIFLATRVLQIQGKAMNIIELTFKIICVILFAKALAGCFTTDSKTMRKLQRKFMTEADDNRVNFIYKTIRCVIYIIAVLVVIALLGINLNTILAGLGIGSVVSNNVNICSSCKLGAGAVVVKNITEPGTYVGVPVRRVDR